MYFVLEILVPEIWFQMHLIPEAGTGFLVPISGTRLLRVCYGHDVQLRPPIRAVRLSVVGRCCVNRKWRTCPIAHRSING